MLAVMEQRVLGVPTAPVGPAPALATIQVLAASPVRAPEGTARLAGDPAAWPSWSALPDEEPTWEDAEWQ